MKTLLLSLFLCGVAAGQYFPPNSGSSGGASGPTEKTWQLAGVSSGAAVTAVSLPVASPTVPTLQTTANGTVQATQNFTLGTTTCLQLGPWQMPATLPASMDLRLTAASVDTTHSATIQVSTGGGSSIDPVYNTANTLAFTPLATYSDAVLTGITLTGLAANAPVFIKVCAVATSLTSDLKALSAKVVLR